MSLSKVNEGEFSSSDDDVAMLSFSSQNKKRKNKHMMDQENIWESPGCKTIRLPLNVDVNLLFPSLPDDTQVTRITAGSSKNQDTEAESMDILPFVEFCGICRSKSLGHSSENVSKRELDRPAKSQKLQDQDEDKDKFESGFAFLPDVVLIKIFKFLTTKQRCRAAEVCRNWHHISRSEILWKQIQLLHITIYEMLTFIAFLPSSVTHLRLSGTSGIFPVNILEILFKLQERCPSLQVFILEDACLYPFIGDPVIQPTLKNGPFFRQRYSKEEIFKKNHFFMHFVEAEYRKSHVEYHNLLLPELTVLSLQNVTFFKLSLYPLISPSTLPNLKVLDLSESEPMYAERGSDIADGMLAEMIHLEELYLKGWTIRSSSIREFLMNVKKLRILNLENTEVSDSTISTLKRNGKSLEELYLGNTVIHDIFNAHENEIYFPRLQKVCVSRNSVGGIGKLIKKCPMLTHVFIETCYQRSIPTLTQLMQEKLVFHDSCDHIKKFLNFSQ